MSKERPKLTVVSSLQPTKSVEKVLSDTRFDGMPTDLRKSMAKVGITELPKIMRQAPIVELGVGMSVVARGSQANLAVDVPGVTVDDEFARYLMFARNGAVQKHSIRYLALATMLQSVIKFDHRFNTSNRGTSRYEREVKTWQTAGALALETIPYEVVASNTREVLLEGGQAIERDYLHDNEYVTARLLEIGTTQVTRIFPPTWIGLCFPKDQIS